MSGNLSRAYLSTPPTLPQTIEPTKMPKKQKNTPALRFPEFSGEWEEKKTREIIERVSVPVEVEKEKLYQQIGIRSHGKGIFYKDFVTGEELGNKRVFWLQENVFIVNIVFAWEQAVARTTSKELGMIASHRFPMYKSIKGITYLDFILYFFYTKKGKHFLGLASPGGAGRNKTLGQKTFEELKFKTPSYLEQKKIAQFLTAIDEKIQQLQQKKTLLEQYKKGVMQQIFSQKIRFKDEKGKAFPKWEEKQLGDLGNTYNGLTGKTKEDFGEGDSFITYKQIFDKSYIDTLKFQKVKIEPSEKQNQAKYGDVFFTTSSETPLEVGFTSVLLSKIDNLYLNSFCFGFRPNSLNELSPDFSRYLFRSSIVRKKIIPLAQGSTRYNMSKIQLMKIKMKLPSLEEQKKIAQFLTAIDEKIERVGEQLKKTKEYKKGLLQQMFV